MLAKSERFAKVAQEKKIGSIKRQIKQLNDQLVVEQSRLKRGTY